MISRAARVAVSLPSSLHLAHHAFRGTAVAVLGQRGRLPARHPPARDMSGAAGGFPGPKPPVGRFGPASFPSKDGVRTRPRSPEARKPAFERFHGPDPASEDQPSPPTFPALPLVSAKQAAHALQYSTSRSSQQSAMRADVAETAAANLSANLGSAAARGSKRIKGVRSVKPEPMQSTLPPPLVGLDPERSRATAFCTAEKYDFEALKPLLQHQYIVNPYLAEDVYHIKLVSKQEEDWLKLIDASASKSGSSGQSAAGGEMAVGVPAEAFIFDNGSFVTWGATTQQQQQIKALLKQVEINGYEFEETEWFEFIRDASRPNDLVSDVIILGNELPLAQAELGFSSGMSRSVKLASLEELLDQFLDSNRHIPEVLRTGKPLRLSRAEVLKQLGTLLSFRGTVNIHAELLDDPDFLWSNKDMEDCFDKVSRNLDIRRRITTFNKKLDYANELAAFLSDHLNQRHGTKLEWIIIWLIAVEVVSEVIHYAERLGYLSLDQFARKPQEDTDLGEGNGTVLVGWRKGGKSEQ